MDKKNLFNWILGILIIVLGVVLFLFTQNILRMQRAGAFHSRHLHRPLAGSSTPEYRAQFQPEDIRSWMTFAFIDQALGLPPTYLRDQLHIIDKRYPNLSVRNAAQELSVTPDALMFSLKASASSYASSSSN